MDNTRRTVHISKDPEGENPPKVQRAHDTGARHDRD